ncbi:DUF1800 domain-containing protein [Nocardia sp. alder85J]|uniref:DUF1800 domain-containing protein n=1 Tax=Nocardia sp. alder85J TaxID=2862949 RepID=UPI001CD56E38|nr:DUF1800 domain-containing protein [Nocardia sp. alder85J]MCX4094171.1 DUF1800 domain-containing protein [Nocardia sp. alder85J]
MSEERAVIAQILRRTTFGPRPGGVEPMLGLGAEGVVTAVLAAPPVSPGVPRFDEESDDDAAGPLAVWLQAMRHPAAGVHEKLVWFWHAHLTSSHEKVDSWSLMWDQHLLLRRHALGNFRELLDAVTVDAAMLRYLDGDGSDTAAPNENYGRELMELFALGRGAYTQADVRAAATALAGWSVGEDLRVRFDRGSAPDRPVTLLGRPVSGARDVVDAICDHPACARFVAGSLYRFFVGAEPAPERLDALAQVFRAANLEISVLVSAILHDDSFPAGARPRYPIEWVVAALSACGIDDAATAYDALTALGQVPFAPPSVAGWPAGTQWLAPSCAVARSALAVQAPALPEIAGAADPVAAAFARAGLYQVSATTADAARELHDQLRGREPLQRSAVLLGAVLAAPEFALA